MPKLEGPKALASAICSPAEAQRFRVWKYRDRILLRTPAADIEGMKTFRDVGMTLAEAKTVADGILNALPENDRHEPSAGQTSKNL